MTALEITGKRRNLEISYAETARVGPLAVTCLTMATSSTSTATSVEQTTSDCDEIESSDGPPSNVQTFLNKLRAPRRSELTRKRKVRVTSSGYRKKENTSIMYAFHEQCSKAF